MKKGALTFLIAVAALSLSSRSASALVITDSDFFSDKTHILITFETDGLGNKLNLAGWETKLMPSDEYAHYGFTFEPDIHWINQTGFTFDDAQAIDEAQAIGGSPEIGIPGGIDDFTINMSFPTRAFGFWVINIDEPFNYPNLQDLTLQAYGAEGLIEEVTFEGDAIDGIIENRAGFSGSGNIENYTEYGFLGIASEQFITSIHIRKGYTMLDNFMFSPVPEPATVILLGLGSLALLRKRPT